MPEQIEVWVEKLRRALAREVNYRVRPPVVEGRAAAVILVLALDEGDAADPSLLVTRRTDRVGTHKGQYAFPGGVMDPEDVDAGGLVTTALRELEEEMGIPRASVRAVGELPKIWTPSGFTITPVVGVLLEPREKVQIHLSVDEVENYFWVKLSELTLPGVHAVEMIAHAGGEFPVEVFQVGEHRVWGATGAMLRNLLDRLANDPH